MCSKKNVFEIMGNRGRLRTQGPLRLKPSTCRTHPFRVPAATKRKRFDATCKQWEPPVR